MIVENTNFQATANLIASLCKEAPVEENLDMVIFLSDTQFDEMVDVPGDTVAGNYFKLAFERVGRKAPLCCFWNLNGDVTNTPAEPNENGIIMISGYSHTMLNSLAETIIAASQVTLEEFNKQKELAQLAFMEEVRLSREKAYEEEQLNTFQVMLDFIDGKFGEILRKALEEVKEGIFKDYSYTPIM